MLNFSCSLPCFKSHKADGKCDEIQASLTSKPNEEIAEDRKPSRINVFTTVDTVPPERLEKLSESTRIHELLKNPHLRNFLEEIFKATNSWNAMKLAMMEPIFMDFADECSKVVDGSEENEVAKVDK